MDDRPAPSPQKLLGQFNDWLAETELPGRTMSYLKTGFLPEILAEQTEADGVSEMLDAWGGWESGKTHPSVVLEELRDRGLASLLTELSQT
ncbi:MAG: hypothetical protein ACR2P0_03945 [Acidimicrobiales bacterium]